VGGGGGVVNILLSPSWVPSQFLPSSSPCPLGAARASAYACSSTRELFMLFQKPSSLPGGRLATREALTDRRTRRLRLGENTNFGGVRIGGGLGASSPLYDVFTSPARSSRYTSPT